MLIPYIASYFYYSDHSLRNSDFVVISPISFLIEAAATVLIVHISKRFLLYDLIIAGVFISSALIFLSSFVQSATLFCITYGVGLGLLSSVLFLPILLILWDHHIENKSRNTGIVLAGYCLGPVPFGILFTLLVNPEDKASLSISSEGEAPETIYPESVAERVPFTIRITALCFLLVSVLGLALLPRKAAINQEEVKKTRTLKDFFRSKVFWNIFFTLMNGFSAIGYIQLVYKIIGNLYINDDYFLSFMGSASFAVAGGARVAYGFMFNRYNWRYIMIGTYATYSILSLAFWCSVHSKSLYLSFMIGLSWCSGAFYGGVVAQTHQAFPGDDWILSYIGLAYTPAYMMPYLFEKWITPEVGYFWTTMIISLFPITALIQIIFHPSPKPRIIVSSLEDPIVAS